jgi:hypothetical protein
VVGCRSQLRLVSSNLLEQPSLHLLFTQVAYDPPERRALPRATLTERFSRSEPAAQRTM